MLKLKNSMNISDTKKEKPIKESLLNFFNHTYQHINIERLKHLDSLQLNFENKKIIDLGSGIGDHTLFYLLKNCIVQPVEGRADLVEFIRFRFNLEPACIDFERDLLKLDAFSGFDFIHCYGLLYHLNNPEAFLKKVSSIGNTLLLETMVSYHSDNDLNLIPEDRLNSTQSLSGTGCRPNRKWLFNTLKKNFEHVYVPLTQPEHPQFPKNWDEVKPDNTHTRVVFIASHHKIVSDKLIDNLIQKHL